MEERRNQRLPLVLLAIVFVLLLVLSFWQSHLDFGEFAPGDTGQTFVFWALSTLVVLGLIALGFVIFRNLLKLYLERRQGRVGSRLKTKLVAGAICLSIVPVIALFLFSFDFLNRTIDKWFKQPKVDILAQSLVLLDAMDEVMLRQTEHQASWLASLPEVAEVTTAGTGNAAARRRLNALIDGGMEYAAIVPAGTHDPLLEAFAGDVFTGEMVWRVLHNDEGQAARPEVYADVKTDYAFAVAPIRVDGNFAGSVVVGWQIPATLRAGKEAIQAENDAFQTLHREHRSIRKFYLALMGLIAVFVLFFGIWLALLFSRQISTPIEALLAATGELSSGHLGHRVETPAIDEFASLVSSFNDMTTKLESNTHQLQETNHELEAANEEIERRRQLINAILESITPGVLSAAADGTIQKKNSSLGEIFPAETIEHATSVTDLFEGEDAKEIDYLFHRARRVGLASREFEMERGGSIRHLTVSVSSLRRGEVAGAEPGFVVVCEDMSELLQAQKSAAWREVARRVAHEIKNPLTPIALSTERMSRMVDRLETEADPAERERLRQRFDSCTQTIAHEVESLRLLVDEFAKLARFPAARPVRCRLETAIETAQSVFEGRLHGITLRTDVEPSLPDCYLDVEQFKRVIVNLVDNACEAMQESWHKEVRVAAVTGLRPDTVELSVSDSGPGISPEDKEKLFVPYFSTKRRGTGLGLAIVSRIVNEHGATIRVEDNRPSGTRFVIEIPTADSRDRAAAEVLA